MKPKVIVYFVSALFIVSSIAFYFISNEMPEKKYFTTGEYDIWITESYDSVLHNDLSETVANTEAATDIRQYLYININAASIEEFMLLDGIGEIIAGNIINYRAYMGGFKNIEEIMNVSGIGEKTFSAIKDHIYVEDPVYYSDPTEIQTDEVEETFQESVPINVAEIPETNPEAEEYASETQAAYLKYDLNTVTYEELLTIPGIGAETAESIINLRTSIKYFSHPYELLYADGMTEEYLSEIINFFYVKNIEN